LRRKSNSDLPPEFIVIAGPNGAGKSTTSKNILLAFGIQAFDWDKEFHTKWKKFDFDPIVTAGIRESVNNDFQKHINSAFFEKRSVAYETTFHSSYNFHLAGEARDMGYRNTLLFLALSNPPLFSLCRGNVHNFRGSLIVILQYGIVIWVLPPEQADRNRHK